MSHFIIRNFLFDILRFAVLTMCFIRASPLAASVQSNREKNYIFVINGVVSYEKNAAHMADDWARATGRMGVSCSTVGSGAANPASGLCEAYMDSSPVLAITANMIEAK